MRKYLAVMLVVVVCSMIALGVTTSQTNASSVGMVAAANPYASEVGAYILEIGGNAIDAAIAVSLALGVVEPYASGLGGEGYALISLANGEKYAIDFRAAAPEMATYEKLAEEGLRISTAHRTPRGACVPGVVAALQAAYDLGASLPLEVLVEPAIRLAREGFIVDPTFAGTVSDAYEALLYNAFDFLDDGLAWEEGQLHQNLELADILEHLVIHGLNDFYHGILADKIEAFMIENNGYLRKSDLEKYQAWVQEPLHGTYRGYDVFVPHPPVSGPHMIAILNILENFNLSAFTWDDPLGIHIIQQTLIFTDVDRRSYISDPMFHDLPIEGFMSKEYAKARFMEIDLKQAMDTSTYFDRLGDAYPYQEGKGYVEAILESIEKEIAFASQEYYESPSTTNFAIIDSEGNAVSWIQTVSSFWGCTAYMNGFFFNNQLQNYAGTYRPGDVINLEPGMRPRTTICPTIIEKDGEVRWVLGTPGAGRIMSTMTQLVVGLIDFQLPIDVVVRLPKYVGATAYRNLPLEDAFPESTYRFLTEVLGHTLSFYTYPDLFFGGPNIISREPSGMIVGVGSIRRGGAASAPEW